MFRQHTIWLHKLDVGTRFHAAICFREHFGPFRDALGNIAEVNEIECLLSIFSHVVLNKRLLDFHLRAGMSTPTRHHRSRICSSVEPCLVGRKL
jgi:hypothetical protein